MLIERILFIPVLLSTLGVGHALFTPQPGEAQASAADGKSPAHGFARSADGLFRVPAAVGSVMLYPALDTGATRTFLKETSIAKIESAGGAVELLPGRHYVVTTLAGEVRFPVARIEGLVVASQAVGTVEVAVTKGIHAPDLIGQDVIRHLDSIRIGDDRLYVN